ncbi:DnaJ-domain-containing protein [Hysterangium stoloniferum]|nr:DnaJ-domain-containing protein [Hysterangium stoloniferum]
MPFRTVRFFSASHFLSGHYETLNVPKNASKAAIKASYYKLSKKYHPDVNTDPGAKARFQAVSDAYSILGDDRRRRKYNRESEAVSSYRPEYTQTRHPHQHYYDPGFMYETRRRGASYAWENTRRSRAQHHPPPPPPFSQRAERNAFGTHRSGTVGDDFPRRPRRDGRDPFASPNVRRSTGRGDPFETMEDRLKGESIATRFAQVVGILFFIMLLSGGFH